MLVLQYWLVFTGVTLTPKINHFQDQLRFKPPPHPQPPDPIQMVQNWFIWWS